jgi:TRAP-type C4-dicarboxylate transport system substrate-binding protein
LIWVDPGAGKRIGIETLDGTKGCIDPLHKDQRSRKNQMNMKQIIIGGQRMKERVHGKILMCTVVGFLLCLFLPVPATAQINLKFASWVPQHDTMNHAPNLWMKELETRTGGKVKVTPYYGQSLGKVANSLDMLKTGICDLALMPTGLLSKDFPVLDVLSLPGLISNRVVGTELMYALLNRGLLEKEFAGYKPIVLQAHDPFYLVLTKKKVTTLEELKGMKIRFPSITIKAYFEALGATAVSIPPPELFNAINTGILDGTSASPGYLVLSKLYEIMKYIPSHPISSGANIVLMSLKTWNSLPRDVQLIMEELNAKAKTQYLEAGQQQDIESMKQIKAAGMEMYNLSPEELKRWQKLAKPIMDQWVSDTQAAGYPGKDAYETALQVVEKFK